MTGQRVQLEFVIVAREPAGDATPVSARGNHSRDRRAQVAQHPMVQRAIELFGAFPERVDDPASE